MVYRDESPRHQVKGDLDAAVDGLAVAEAHRVPRRVRTLIVAVLLSILAVWGSLLWLRTAYAVPRSTDQTHGRDSASPRLPVTHAVPDVTETIPVGEGTKPIAVAVNPNDDYVYVVNIATGTVSVINGTELLTTIDLKTVDRPASACPGPTPYGRCLNGVGVNRITDHVYVTEWHYDVAQIISGTEVIGWVYAGKGPAGVVPHPYNDSIYALAKWTPGVTYIRDDRDLCFISGSEPNAGAVDPRTGYVYVANSGSNSVAVITDCTKIADIPVGSYPNAIAYDPCNGYIYVVNSGENPATVSVISGTQVIGTIPVGNGNTNLGVDGFWGIERDGSTHIIGSSPHCYVYVANWYSNSVSIISSTHWITDVAVGTNPNTIGVDPIADYIYVANTGSDSVSVIQGTSVVTTVAVGDYPFDLAVNPTTSHVYVANRDDDSVSILALPLTRVYLPLVTNRWPAPSIAFTHVPAWGSFDDLEGQVQYVSPSEYQVAVYIYVSGWWTKPYWDSPLTPIRSDGSWTCDITTGGIDQQATQIAAFLVPNGYDPPSMAGGQALPAGLFENAVAQVTVEREAVFRTIEFSGYTWKVKASETPAGPGPNYFSDRAEDVWVDESGRLHLRIVQQDGRWYCTEVFTEAPLGYGKYVFHVASRVDQLDQNIVLGLFTWDDTAPEHNYREIDIELARWGQAANDNAQYVVQPWDHAGNMHRFNVELDGDDSTYGFDWRADRVFFQSLHGHQPFPGPGETEIASWTNTGDDIPPAGGGNARINLWLFYGDPPSNGEGAEVVIEAFEFTP
jgi:YVTN family beta-propeller protein